MTDNQKKANKYTADNIKVLEGLEAVRVRPAMYIGSTGSTGLHHLVYEVVDNSIDESMAGFCSRIDVTIHFDNSVSVTDNGRGIPVDDFNGEGVSAAEVVMTRLHAGGKFDNDTYKVSGGLHGVGVSVVNALSSKLDLEIKRDGHIYFQKYEYGKPLTPFKKIGKSKSTGTKITFWPDDEIFETTEYDYGILAKRMKELAFLNPSVTIFLRDERTHTEETFHFKGGIVEYVRYLSGNKELVHPKPISLSTKSDEGEIDIAFQYVGSYNENLLSFVNNIKTIEGGTHLTGFKGALTRTINSFAQTNNLIKDLKSGFTGDDVREGLVAVISIRIKDPQFEGQTKAKLGNSEIKGLVESFLNEHLGQFFEENFPVAKAIIGKALMAAQARVASRKAKDLVRKSSLLENTTLPGKLADCQSKDPAESEIFIVEGDSAGGSAKNGRDRRFQAILPLRGKILNVEKASTAKMLESQAINTLIAALGVGIGKEHFDIEKLRYHKIIIMTDADVDGAHIRTLLMTFFFNHMRELIERGHLYLAQPPLYMLRKGKKHFYMKNEKERLDFLFKRVGEESQIVLGPGKNDVLKNAKLVRFLRLINKKNILVDDIERQGIPRELTLTLVEMIRDEDTFRSREKTLAVAEALRALECCRTVDVGFQEEYNTHCIELEYQLNGVVMNRSVNWEFLTGPEFAEVNRVYEKLKSYPAPPYRVVIGNTELEMANRSDLVPTLLDNAHKGIVVQRYKGLGEMNPNQLWETTMNPANRTLLKVQINDFVQSEELFDTLMGSDSTKRREFILENALNVRNLDV